MIAALLGRFFARCIHAAKADEVERCDYDYMTDIELSDVVHGRGHLVDWTEVARRRRAGDVQLPAFLAKRGAL